MKKYEQNTPGMMKEVLKDVFQMMYPGQIYHHENPSHKKFRRNELQFLGKNLGTIDWLDVCEYYKQNGVPLFCLCLIVALLDQGIYNGSHKEKLKQLRDLFVDIATPEKRMDGVSWKSIFCGNDIEWLNIVPGENGRYEYIFTRYENAFLKEIYAKSLASVHKHIERTTQEITDLFEQSLRDYAQKIFNYQSFNDQTFWTQIEFYKQRYKDNCDLKSKAITAVYNFYRYLVNTYPEHSFFEDSINMTDSLLFSQRLLSYIEKEYFFTTFNPYGSLPSKERMVVILRGCESISTNFKKEDWIIVDVSTVKDKNYQEAIRTFITKNFSTSVLSNNISSLAQGLKFILSLKSQKNYPNPNKFYFTNQEAVLIRRFCDTESQSLGTRNNKIGAIRRFLLWEKSIGEMTFDELFFSYLSQYEEPSFSPGCSIPEEDLVKINQGLKEMAREEHVDRLAYVIFHLMLQTEFRISQICHLTIDCISPSVKPNQYIIRSTSKTSHGSKDSYVITGLTYHLLMEAINETDELRERCSIVSNKNYIFLYESKSRSISVMNSQKFNERMKKCAKMLKLERLYTAQNLRDTHMTKAFEHILRNGKSDAELSILSRHKHIDTTKNHYIEMQLEKMLEATYGIEIGGTPLIDASKNVVDMVPENIAGRAAVVENGCGNCTAKRCVVTSSLPCLACEHFITTVAHERYFIKAIEGVDLLIRSAKTKHDKDDLMTVKKLYVLYLKAIYQRKGEVNHD